MGSGGGEKGAAGRDVVIAEDEPFIVESLTFLLEREGHRVRAYGDGDRALHAIASARPDLVILDAMMPGIDGFDVLKRIRTMPARETVPVLVLTAKGQAGDRARMMALGADAFVTKPFSNRALMEEVARLLGTDEAAAGGRATGGGGTDAASGP